MSTDMTWETVSTSSEQTEQFAEKLGRNLKGGEIIELVSDLGGGKTTFTRGLVRGTGSVDRVASPTFTISREYVSPNFTIAHFDFYRLGEAGIVGEELEEYITDPGFVTIIEWGDIVKDIVPNNKLVIEISRLTEETRKLTFMYPDQLGYLMVGLRQ